MTGLPAVPAMQGTEAEDLLSPGAQGQPGQQSGTVSKINKPHRISEWGGGRLGANAGIQAAGEAGEVPWRGSWSWTWRRMVSILTQGMVRWGVGVAE
jgi:hypothetical protein